MTRRAPRSPRRGGFERSSGGGGFTIIELMVVIVISLIISGMALAALLEVKHIQMEASARNQMTRDAQLVMDQLAFDLNYFGVGVPEGLPAASQTSVSGAPGDQMRPALRQATATSLAFAGDLPYPNAELNGVVLLAAISTSGSNHRIAVTSEISPCVPARSGANVNYTCTPENENTPYASHIPSDYTAADACTEANGWPNSPSVPARLCPWGQNKWQRASGNQVPLTIGATDGSWYVVKWPHSTAFEDIAYSGSTNSNGFGLHLAHDFPGSGEHVLDPATLFSGANGTAFVSHIDRVLYSLEAGVLYRRHCWGGTHTSSVDPGDAAWPAVSAGTTTSSATPSLCTPPADGTGWEALVSGVGSFTLRYFDLNNAEVDTTGLDAQTAASVRVVEATIELSRADHPRRGQTISHTLTRRFHLRNWGGIADPSISDAQGGCGISTCGDD